MSMKIKILAAAATLTMVGGLSTVGMLTANAATPSCGHSCIDIFLKKFGSHRSPNFVLDVFRQSARVGQPIILFRASNSDPAEDFTVAFQGTVHDLFVAGLVSAALNLHFSHNAAFEFEYSPNGVGSNLCVGVGSTAANGTPVSLQPCGVFARTVWVVDSRDSIRGFFVPLINGSDTNFSHPFVLHYPGNAEPTDIPRPQLNTFNLQKFSNGVVFNNELWGANFGVLR
jgi:hypothetical protein